jgi:hypothetical protein
MLCITNFAKASVRVYFIGKLFYALILCLFAIYGKIIQLFAISKHGMGIFVEKKIKPIDGNFICMKEKNFVLFS